MFVKLHDFWLQSIGMCLNVFILMTQQSTFSLLEQILGDGDKTVHKIATCSVKQENYKYSSDNSPSSLINPFVQ